MLARTSVAFVLLASLALPGCIAIGTSGPQGPRGMRGSHHRGHPARGGDECCPALQGTCAAVPAQCPAAADVERERALRQVGAMSLTLAVAPDGSCSLESCEPVSCEPSNSDARCADAACVAVVSPAECCASAAPEAACCASEEAVACAAAPAEPAAAAAPVEPEPVDAEKIDELRYAAESAERRVARAEAEREQSAIDQRHAVRRAKLDLSDAQKALAHFDEFEKPMRLARAELELKGSRDYLSEQEEEMQQLELMYEKDDLGDKTKEIVLARGKRRLARAKESFALSQKEMGDLKGVELPKQREKLEREVTAKERDLERAMFQAKTASEDKNQACVDAERAAAKAKRELQKACGDAACCEEAGEDECCEEEQEKGSDAGDDDEDGDEDDDDDDRREDDSRSRRRREA